MTGVPRSSTSARLLDSTSLMPEVCRAGGVQKNAVVHRHKGVGLGGDVGTGPFSSELLEFSRKTEQNRTPSRRFAHESHDVRTEPQIENRTGYFSTWVELLVEKDFGSASPPTDSYTFEYA